jgi:DNA polymerase III subunit alpha
MTEMVHCHTHTEFSLLDGLSKTNDLVNAAKEMGMPALAITDHGAMYGAIEFYKSAKEVGVKPLIGCELYTSPNGMAARDRQNFHLIAIAKDLTGYRNLLSLVSIANLEGFYYKPRVDHELLAKHHDGLIVFSGCASGEVAEAIRADDMDEAIRITKLYREIFGEDYYMEMQSHGLDFQPGINRGVLEIGKKLGIKVVCTNDSHYTCKADHVAQDILLAVQTGDRLSNPDRFHFDGDEHYLKSPDEMLELFSGVPEALHNTLEVAEKCNLEIPFGRLNFPHLPFMPEGETPDSYLAKLCWKGLYKRYGIVSNETSSRLSYELGVVATTGYAPYILFVWDFVRFARSRNIMCGPRGSAAGSIILYCLDITTIEPIAHGLTFERFLNPERIQMPDIDMDFADTRREEVIDYITQLYGREHVAQIITVGRMLAKAAIKDTGRVMDLPIAEVERVTKLIPALPIGITITKAIESTQELSSIYENDNTARVLIDNAKSIEGTVRHVGVHAAGIVVSGDPLIMHTPLQFGKTNKKTDNKPIVTQYEMHALEDIGLLKMDFLGLSNLTLLENAIRIIEEQRGTKIDVHKIPAGDPSTYEMLSNGDSVGVFQLEGGGMRRTLQQFRPTSVHHLAAIVSLYRPGPMAHIPTYIAAKDGKNPIKYPHPKLESILQDTYGVIVYQDQVLQIVQAIAGYSLGHADILRKAMGKKIKEEMAKEKQNFLDGAKSNGVASKVADEIWEYIEPFAGYAFNRAHAYCYAYIAYQTAYLKCNYPIEYMTAMLTTESGNIEKVTAAIGESRRLGLTILAPDINQSKAEFTVVDHDGKRAILYGLAAIKSVDAAAGAIVEDRIKNGRFKSLDNFCERISRKAANKLIIERLIKAGSFDEFGRREQLLSVLEGKMKTGKKAQAAIAAGQTSMLDLLGDDVNATANAMPSVRAASSSEVAAWEKESFGFFLNNHPYEAAFNHLLPVISYNSSEIGEAVDAESITTAGVIIDVRRLITKKGDAMAVVTLEDLHGSATVVVFPKTYKETQDIWEEDKIVIVVGRVNKRVYNDVEEIQLVADSVKTWNGPDDTPTKKEYKIREEPAPQINNAVRYDSIEGLSLLEIVRRNLSKE